MFCEAATTLVAAWSGRGGRPRFTKRVAMVEDQVPQTPDIPFEQVDDDEMVAIEKALLHAHSVSSTFHSVDQAFQLGSKISGHQQLANSSVKPITNSFVYTVASVRTSCDAVDSCRSGRSSTDKRPRNGCVSSRLEDRSSQSPINGARLSCRNMADTTSERRSTVAPASDESSSPFFASSQNLPQFSDESTCVTSLSQNVSQVTEGNAPVNELPALRDNLGQRQRTGDAQDIEDLGLSNSASSGEVSSSGQVDSAVGTTVTLLQNKFGKGLSVTDFTASEWCEKQVEFSLNRGKPEQTPAMKAGSARHTQLENEVVTRVEIEVTTREDNWAVRLMNLITGSRQLLSEGLTRELPVLGLIENIWVVGFIDEIRLIEKEGQELAWIVDTKTRKRRFPPSEPQKRNARLQLMCYKLLWDTMVDTGFPYESFFKHFRLNPQQTLCEDVKSHVASIWTDCEVNCLQDLMPKLMEEVTSQVYPRSVDTLLLRYEWQEDHSLLGEDNFDYEPDWLMDRWHWHSDFWKGDRVASLVPEDETWKCRFCTFADVCTAATKESVG